MDISGVEIGHDIRLLTPEDGSAPRLYHRVDGDEWCETVLPKRLLTGTWDAGDVASKKPFECSGGHVQGLVVYGQWVQAPAFPEEPIDG